MTIIEAAYNMQEPKCFESERMALQLWCVEERESRTDLAASRVGTAK